MMLDHYLPNMRVCAVRAVLRNGGWTDSYGSAVF